MEGIDELLKNPEDYRVPGEDYSATHIVFPVEFKGEKYIVKKPRKSASLINAARVIQNKSFFETRRLSFGRTMIKAEAGKLQLLQGLKVPKLIAYDRGTLVREFLDGECFKDLETDCQKETLEEALQTLEAIHGRAVVVGDAHVKNIIRCKDGAYWFGFDGVFKEYFLDKKEHRFNLKKAKAIDLIKFICSVYTVTENRDTLLYTAELVPRVYRDRQVKETMSSLVNNFPLSVLDEKLNEKVRKILTK